MVKKLKFITYDHFRKYTSPYSIDHEPSEIRFLSLQLVHGIGSRLETKYVKCEEKFFRKTISVLTGLKVSSLVRKCVFCRPKRTGKWGPYGTEILSFLSAKVKYINV